jgi:ribulose-bisphosphate carboxylase large chain
MKPLDGRTIEWLWFDHDARETRLRAVVAERMADDPPLVIEGQIVATYFLVLRTMKLDAAAKEISYHATSGIKDPPPGSLLDACTAKLLKVDAFDATERMGLIRMAFPLKMLLHPDGTLTSTDILHTIAGPTIYDIYERQDARLVSIEIPDSVIRTFPGPAYGPAGLRGLAGFTPDQPAFGTILKPTAGITPEEVGRLVEEAARCPLFMFIKEDENLYPDLDYSPVGQRAQQAAAAIRRAGRDRNVPGPIFAPHITAAPHQITDMLHAAIEGGATAVMFSESFCGGTVRMVREATRTMARPPAIYGHNAGIGIRAWRIYREVLDLLARLEGIDFRQTAPLRPGNPYIKPYGAELAGSEQALSRPLPGIQPTMIVRAGGLDQGNVCMNLADAEKRGLTGAVLFLAGSAINGIKNAAGEYDPQLGAQAMLEAIEVHRSGELRGVSMDDEVRELVAVSQRRNLRALREALRQRYPHEAA